MSEVTIKLKELHPAQQQVYNSQSRFTVLGCGRRFGKTDLGIDRITNAIIDTSLPYFYTAPTHTDMIEVRDMFANSLHGIISEHNKSERIIRFVTGATLRFFSFDAVDRMRGKPFAGGICDEAAAVANLEYAWTRVIMPTLADYSGWCWFLSSFRGRNYFHTLYQWGIDPLRPEWSGFSFKTSDNPHIPPEEIELAKRTLPQKAFEEEYEAIPNDDYGAVFRGVADIATGKPTEPERNHRYVFGVDFARYHDFTVIIVFDETTKSVVWMDRFNQVDWELQRGRIMALALRYAPRTIVAEWNSVGEPNIEALQKSGLTVEAFKTTPSSKPALIDALALAIENQEITILDDDVLVNELQSYEMERLPSGTFRYSAPAGGHDDTVIALALALHGADQPQFMVGNIPRSGKRNGYHDRR